MDTLTRSAVAEPPKERNCTKKGIAEAIPIARKVLEDNTPDDNGSIRRAKTRWSAE